MENTNQTGKSGGHGASAGQKIKGAAEVMHGIGDSLRGRFMDTVDSGVNPGARHSETNQGRIEVETGMARMRGDVSGVGPQISTGAQEAGTNATSRVGTGTRTGTSGEVGSIDGGTDSNGQHQHYGNAPGGAPGAGTGVSNPSRTGENAGMGTSGGVKDADRDVGAHSGHTPGATGGSNPQGTAYEAQGGQGDSAAGGTEGYSGTGIQGGSHNRAFQPNREEQVPPSGQHHTNNGPGTSASPGGSQL